MAIFAHFWLKLAVFSVFDPVKKCFWQKLYLKESREYSEAIDKF